MKSPLFASAWLTLAGASLLLPLSLAQAQLPGTVDPSFNPGTELLTSGTFVDINAVAVQSDGKVLVATSPYEEEAQDITLVRLNADGTLDSTFNATVSGGSYIEAIALESNGHIVIGGDFTSVDGTARNFIAVLNPDGTLDTGFDPGAGANSDVTNILVQSSGNIVITGDFTAFAGVSTNYIARVTPAGGLDTNFQSGSGFAQYNSVNALASLPNGQLLLGGSLTSYGSSNTAVGDIVRLNSDGSLDTSFTADSTLENVYYLSPQSTGEVVADGYLQDNDEIFRLNTDGSLDQTFPMIPDTFAQVLVEPNDQILLGGQFYYVDGVALSGIARLDANGAVDMDFNPGSGANGQVEGIVLGPNNEVFVAGIFNGISNTPRDQLALLYAGNPPGTVQFSASTYSVNESGASVQVMVQRVGGDTGAISVNYATVDGTAVAGADYTATSGTLTWADGDVTPKSFTVPILNPLVYGGSKNFSVNLGSPSAGVTLGAQAQVLILDSDPAPQPGITLTSPPTDITAITGSTVPLSASVSDPGSILSNVQFTVNGASVATITGTGPYVSSITAGAPGTYTIAAVATDTQGRISTSSHVLTVLAVDSSNPPPSITLLTDLNDRLFGQGATIPITVSGVSGDGSPLVSVTFYANGVPFATIDGSTTSAHPVHSPIRKDASSPAPANGIFQANYQMPANTNQIINLLAVALSKLGVSQSTPVASIQGVSPAVDQAPLVALNNATSQVQVGQTLNIPATVSDPDGGPISDVASPGGRRTKDLTAASGQIARMEYFVNQLKVKDSAQQPFGFSFTPSASGQYIVDAIATDGSGVSTVSTPVTVTAIAPPVVSLSAVGNSEAIAGVKNGKVLFTRTGGDMTLDLNVNYKVGGGTVNGTDFQLLSGTLVIPAGQTSVKLKIVPIVESPQPDRKVNIKLLPATDGSYTLGSDIKVKLQLIDNE
jgi:uncharacterized delta-60 repeat protein